MQHEEGGDPPRGRRRGDPRRRVAETSHAATRSGGGADPRRAERARVNVIVHEPSPCRAPPAAAPSARSPPKAAEHRAVAPSTSRGRSRECATRSAERAARAEGRLLSSDSRRRRAQAGKARDVARGPRRARSSRATRVRDKARGRRTASRRAARAIDARRASEPIPARQGAAVGARRRSSRRMPRLEPDSRQIAAAGARGVTARARCRAAERRARRAHRRWAQPRRAMSRLPRSACLRRHTSGSAALIRPGGRAAADAAATRARSAAPRHSHRDVAVPRGSSSTAAFGSRSPRDWCGRPAARRAPRARCQSRRRSRQDAADPDVGRARRRVRRAPRAKRPPAAAPSRARRRRARRRCRSRSPRARRGGRRRRAPRDHGALAERRAYASSRVARARAAAHDAGCVAGGTADADAGHRRGRVPTRAFSRACEPVKGARCLIAANGAHHAARSARAGRHRASAPRLAVRADGAVAQARAASPRPSKAGGAREAPSPT